MPLEKIARLIHKIIALLYLAASDEVSPEVIDHSSTSEDMTS
jgi:hypothetical protein